MPLFGERERAEEARYARNQEVAFRIKVRRNKLLAEWAAAKMGKSGAAARQYASEFAVAEISDRDDTAVVSRIADDLLAEGIFVPEIDIRHHLERFSAAAARAYKAGARTRL
jgi:hypothetical protein